MERPRPTPPQDITPNADELLDLLEQADAIENVIERTAERERLLQLWDEIDNQEH